MKRVLIVTQHYWPEAFRVNDLAQGFVEDGYQVDVLCGLPNYPKGYLFNGYRYSGPRKQFHEGVTIYRAGEIPRKDNTALRIFLNYISWPVCALFSLWRLKGPYDAVLCYNTSPVMMSLPAIVYAKLHHVPMTNYVLDIWPENLYSVLPIRTPLLQKIATAVSDWHYRRSDRLIAMSDSLCRRLVERSGKAENLISVIPQHCEDFYAVSIRDEELAQKYAGSFNLVFTGNFSPAQSLDTVIRAAVSAQRRGAQKLHLLLVGDGMSRNELEQLVWDLDAGSIVTFTGSVPPTEIPRYTGIADALVASLCDSPDLGMTVPAKIASYMAAEKPLLVSMNGEGAAVVRDHSCGLASDAGDMDGLARNILSLYHADEDTLQQMGRNAFTYYRVNYTRRAVLDRLEHFIF